MLPPAEEPELAEFLKTWKPRHPIDPRDGHGDHVMDIMAVTAQFVRPAVVELTHWVELGWVMPDTDETGWCSARSTWRVCG